MTTAVEQEILGVEREYWDSMISKDPSVATKLTGDVTVAPFAGEHTTTPGEVGAEHGGVVVPVPESETVCGLPAAESVIVIEPVRVPV